MKVLVTGGAGFIGSHLVRRLLKNGHEVTVSDNLSTGRLANLNHCSWEEDRFRFVRGDIRDKEFVRNCLMDTDSVVHLAAIASVPFSTQNPTETHEVNAGGTANLLEACVKSNVQKFVLASSCAVYGEARYLPINEDHPLAALSPYADSKIAAEGHCRTFHEKYGIRTVILRLFNVYGNRLSSGQDDGVITRFLQFVWRAEPPVIFGDGEQTRDFIHVDDAVGAIIRVLDNSGPIEGVYNVGSGNAVTVNWLAATLFKIMGRERQRPIYRPNRPSEVRHSHANIRHLAEHLGYKPTIRLEQGLEQLVRDGQQLGRG